MDGGLHETSGDPKQRPASHGHRLFKRPLLYGKQHPPARTGCTHPTLQAWRLEIPRKRTCECPRWLDSASKAHQKSKPVTRPCVPRFTSSYIHTSHFSKHTEITLQGVPNREYMLRLFVENVERELQKKDDHIWIPAQRQYVPYFPNTFVDSLAGGRDICPTSQIRAEIRIKKFWVRNREARQLIDLHEVFSDYWSSSNNEFTVSSQSLSPTGPCRSD